MCYIKLKLTTSLLHVILLNLTENNLVNEVLVGFLLINYTIGSQVVASSE